MITLFNVRFLRLVSDATKKVGLAVALRVGALVAQLAAFSLLAQVVGGRGDAGAPPLFALFVAAHFLLGTAANVASRRAASIAAAQTTKRLYAKTVALGPAYSASAKASELATLMGEGSSRLRPYFSAYLPQFFYALAAPLACFVALAPVCLPAALVMLVFVPFIPGSIMMFMKRAKKFMGEYWGTYVDLGGSFLDAVRGLNMLKGYRADGRWQERLDAEAEGFREVTMRLLRVQLGNVTLMDFFTYAGMAAGLGVSWAAYAAGSIGLPAFALTVLVSPSFFMPMRSFGAQFHTGMNANTIIDQALALLDEPEPEHGEKALSLDCPSIEVSGLSFAYPDGTCVLHGVDFEMTHNTLTGLTGVSGGGKSTLARLVCGLLGTDYQGSVRVCGVELRDIEPAELWRAVTYVGPSSRVFKGTVRSNLRLAKPEASEPELWGALRNAKLDEFVLAHGGLDLEVREGGENLSGGQRQRLCFARALLRDTPIYVFDEVASNIDQVSETAIIDGIEQLSVHKTILMVSHRLKPLAWADENWVMENGGIAEHGEHPVLMQAGGAYRALWDQLAELEATADTSGVEYDQETYVPTEGELRVAEIATRRAVPLMGARAMQAALEVLSYRRYFNAPSANVPDGHPAWIPIPGLSDAREGVDVAVDGEGPLAGEEPGEKVPGTTGPQDAAPTRGFFATIRGLMGLTRGMVREVLAAALLGCAGIGLAAGVPAAASAGALRLAPGPACAGALLACAILRGVLHRRERLLTHDQTFRTLAQIRSRLFGKLRELAPARLAARDAGDLVTLLTSDVEMLEGVYSRCLAPVLSAVLASVVVTALAFAASVPLGLVVAAGLALLGVVLPTASSALTSKRSRELSGYGALMATWLLDSLAGMADLAQCGRAAEYADEVGGHADSLNAAERAHTAKVSALSAAGDSGALLFVGLAVAVAAAFGTGAASALLAAGALQSVLAPVVDCGRLGFSLQATLAAASRILDVFEQRPETAEVISGASLGRFTGASLDDVSFSYGGGPVLDGFSLDVGRGRVLRLIGPSGVGKSTALRLLMRWWDPDRGRALVNGLDLRGVDGESLRSTEALMEQDTYLMEGTLGENILLANPDATEAQLARAIEGAALSEVVARLPEGLDTRVGQGASPLSDGERQRVGLARAFLSGAELLLLDEPTSNLDALSEAAVLNALGRGRADRTVVVATHRRAVACVATETLVMEGDRRS